MDTYSYPYSHANEHGHGYAVSDTHTHEHTDGYAHANANPYAHADDDSDRHVNGHGHPNRYANSMAQAVPSPCAEVTGGNDEPNMGGSCAGCSFVVSDPGVVETCSSGRGCWQGGAGAGFTSTPAARGTPGRARRGSVARCKGSAW